MTATCFWKLEREHNLYAEETYIDDDHNDGEATGIEQGLPDIVAGERRCNATELERGEAQAKVSLNTHGAPRTATQIPRYGAPSAAVPIELAELPTRPPAALTAPPAIDTSSVRAFDNAASPRPNVIFHRGSSASSSSGVRIQGMSAHIPQVDTQEDDNDVLPGHAISNDVLRHSVLSEDSEIETDLSEFLYDRNRQSGIDWKDNENSIQGSDTTKYGISEFDRSSYSKRYDDY